MTRQIIFHIGLQKTGTTSFQHFCHLNRRALRSQGLLYPTSNTGLHRNHAPLVASYLFDRRDYSLALRPPAHDDAVRRLIAEIEAADVPHTLVSAEHFSQYFGPKKVQRLARDFAAFNIRVLVTLRDHLARFTAAYATHVAAGGTLTIEDYAAGALGPGSIVTSVKDMLTIWQDEVGSANVRLVDYDAEDDLIGTLLAQCGVPHFVGERPSARHRVSLDAEMTGSLRLANLALVARQTVRADRSLGAWLQLSVFSILCRRALMAVPRARPAAPWRLDAATAARIDEIAAADRTWLKAQHGLDPKTATAPLPVEIAEPQPLPPEDVELAHAIARRATRGLWLASEGLVRLWGLAARATGRIKLAIQSSG